jgi:hypothetical protein
MLSAKFLSRSMFFGAALAALLITSEVPSRAGDEKTAAPSPSPDDPAGLEPLRATLETVFVRGDPGPLRPYLPRRARIYVAAGVLDVADGYYGADQIAMILRRLFDGRATLRFSLLPPEGDAGPGLRLPARWVYRQAGTKTERRIAFTVVAEGTAWHLREIREWK